MSVPSDHLTPYIDRLPDEVSSSLRALIGVDDVVPLEWEVWIEDPARGTGRIRLHVGSSDRPIEMLLLIRQVGGRLVLEAQRSRIPYRRLDDQALDADVRLERRIAVALAAARPDVRARVVAAAHAWSRNEGLGDWMYRQISGSRGTSATVRLGFQCNQRCRFCWQGRSWPAPPHALYRKWIEEFAALGIQALTISGGEPTLHPGLAELVGLATDRGLQVTLQTNAIRLRDAAFLDTLLQAGVRAIMASYHSADSDVSDAMTGVRGSHANTLLGILACCSRAADVGLEVRLNCVVERSNLPGLEGYARHVVERFVEPFAGQGLRCVEFSFPSMSHDGERWRDAVAPLDEVRGPLVEAVRILRDAGVAVELFSGCGFPACVLRDAPDLVEQVDRDGLDAKDLEGRTYAAACAACTLRPGCLGLRNEYLEVHGERGLAPFDAEPRRRRR